MSERPPQPARTLGAAGFKDFLQAAFTALTEKANELQARVEA